MKPLGATKAKFFGLPFAKVGRAREKRRSARDVEADLAAIERDEAQHEIESKWLEFEHERRWEND